MLGVGRDELDELHWPAESTVDADLRDPARGLDDLRVIHAEVELGERGPAVPPVDHRERGALGLSGQIDACGQHGLTLRVPVESGERYSATEPTEADGSTPHTGAMPIRSPHHRPCLRTKINSGMRRSCHVR